MPTEGMTKLQVALRWITGADTGFNARLSITSLLHLPPKELDKFGHTLQEWLAPILEFYGIYHVLVA